MNCRTSEANLLSPSLARLGRGCFSCISYLLCLWVKTILARCQPVVNFTPLPQQLGAGFARRRYDAVFCPFLDCVWRMAEMLGKSLQVHPWRRVGKTHAATLPTILPLANSAISATNFSHFSTDGSRAPLRTISAIRCCRRRPLKPCLVIRNMARSQNHTLSVCLSFCFCEPKPKTK